MLAAALFLAFQAPGNRSFPCATNSTLAPEPNVSAKSRILLRFPAPEILLRSYFRRICSVRCGKAHRGCILNLVPPRCREKSEQEHSTYSSPDRLEYLGQTEDGGWIADLPIGVRLLASGNRIYAVWRVRGGLKLRALHPGSKQGAIDQLALLLLLCRGWVCIVGDSKLLGSFAVAAFEHPAFGVGEQSPVIQALHTHSKESTPYRFAQKDRTRTCRCIQAGVCWPSTLRR